MDLLAGLNAGQRKAVGISEGPALVIAGPGSGKTRVLTCRVGMLVREHYVPPYRIMAVTFTNKAAREMRDRLKSLIGDMVNQLAIGTFHANCARILRRDGQALGLPNNFNIFDRDDQMKVVRQAIKELNLDDKRFAPRAVLSAISQAKSELTTPERYKAKTYWHEVAGRIYQHYDELLAANDALDFDDLLMKTALLLRQVPEVLSKYQQRYLHILVDEFQDTNAAQYELLGLLAQEHRNLFVVGDEDQSIYSWRGADSRHVSRFRQDYPEAQVILLERNYRSTQTILDVANAVISRNIQRTQKHLHTEREGGVRILARETYNESEESAFVIEEIERLVKAKECELGDVAVMYRTNAQSRAIEDAFIVHGMPYKLVGATRFYERREIRDVLAYLRVIHNPHDNISLMRIINVPARTIGNSTMAGLSELAAHKGIPMYEAIQVLQEDPAASSISVRGRKALLNFSQFMDELIAMKSEVNVVELIDRLLLVSGYGRYIRDGTPEGEERWENILELRNVAAEYVYLPVEAALTVFLEEVSLVSDIDNLTETNDLPTLLTLHAAKGLEFGTVFIVGMNEGLLPHNRSIEDMDAIEEERRLCYVGVTRAKDRLYLLHTFKRTQYGSTEFSEPSRFLADIPQDLIEGGEKKQARQISLGMEAGRYVRRSASVLSPAKPAQKQDEVAQFTPRFKTGDKVSHANFGEGTVVESRLSGGDEEVTVAFKGRGIKRLLAGYLSKI